MKFSKLDLLTMLIGLFLLSSCKDSNTIGLDLASGRAIDAQLYDSVGISSFTEKDDAVNTAGLVRHPIGQMADPIFGETIASTAMTVNVPSSSYTFGKNAVIDSAILILPYSTQFYGDTTQTYSFTVKQLKDDMTLKRTFLSTDIWADGDLMGTYSGLVKPTTPLKVTDIVSGKADTLKSAVPQIRIKLNNNLIQQRIINLDSVSLSKNDRFIDKFRGLHVSATATGIGGMPFFNFSGSDAKVEIFYKKDGTTASTRDTVVVGFPINTTTGPVAATIAHNYIPGSDITKQIVDKTTQYNQTYVQAMSGLRNRLNFDFSSFKSKLNGKKISINKAELVIDASPNSDVYFTTAQRLTLYRLDIAGKRANVPDNDNSTSSGYVGDRRALGSETLFGGYFDSVNGRYIFTVTSFIQDLLDGRLTDQNAYISPTSFTEFNVSPFATTASRAILLKPKLKANGADKGIKLNIFYTKVD